LPFQQLTRDETKFARLEKRGGSSSPSSLERFDARRTSELPEKEGRTSRYDGEAERGIFSLEGRAVEDESGSGAFV